jgi:hypothetical protein
LHQPTLLLVDGGALSAKEVDFFVASVENDSDAFLGCDVRKRKPKQAEVLKVDLLAVTNSNHCRRQPADEIG